MLDAKFDFSVNIGLFRYVEAMSTKEKLKPLDDMALAHAANCLKILANPNRLQIVQLLLTEKTFSVNEISSHCELSQPTTSDHLRLMQRCGLLKSKKEGRAVYYEIAEPHLQDIMQCVQKQFG